MPRGWKAKANEFARAKQGYDRAVKKYGELKRTRNRSLEQNKNLHFWEAEIKKEERAVRKAGGRLQRAVVSSIRNEAQKRAKYPSVPKIQPDPRTGYLSLAQGMQFFARIIDVFDPDEKASDKFLREVGLTNIPLKLEKKETRSITMWFYSNLANDCAEEVKAAIEQDELGIKLSKGWIERRRRMAYGGVPQAKRKWGIKKGMTLEQERKANARARQLKGIGQFKPPLITRARFKFPKGSLERQQGLVRVLLNKGQANERTIGVKPSHPLIWTGTLLDSIEGWSDFRERSAYYGVRSRGRTHPISNIDILDVANILVYRYNFLARPAVKKRVRKVLTARTMELINILVG